MNKCQLIGRLTKDVELRTTNSGKLVATFSIAVNRRFKKDETDFFNIVQWGKGGELSAKYLKKGSLCAVAGEIQNRSYEAKDGTKRYITEIIAEEVQFLSTLQKQEQNASGAQPQMQEVQEDMPF